MGASSARAPGRLWHWGRGAPARRAPPGSARPPSSARAGARRRMPPPARIRPPLLAPTRRRGYQAGAVSCSRRPLHPHASSTGGGVWTLWVFRRRQGRHSSRSHARERRRRKMETKERNADRAGPPEERSVRLPGNRLVTTRVAAERTGWAYSLFEVEVGVGGVEGPHVQ